MLSDWSPEDPSEFDHQVYETVVPPDHHLRNVLQVIPWDDFEELLAPYYSPDQGRPAKSPVRMLKLEYLRWNSGSDSTSGSRFG